VHFDALVASQNYEKKEYIICDVSVIAFPCPLFITTLSLS